MGKEIKILGSTQDQRYLLASVNNIEVGWIDNRAVSPFLTYATNYSTYVTNGNYEVDSLPWGEIGFKKLGLTSNLLGQHVEVTRESSNNAYVYISVNNIGQGWIDKRALGLKGVAYNAVIKDGKYEIDSLPWGTPGFEKIGVTSDYMGGEIQIAGSTANGNYLLMRVNDTDVGWIDARSVNPFITTVKNYKSHIISGRFDVDTLPWGEYGYRQIGKTAELLGRYVTVTKESSNKAYLFVNIDGNDIGWIDKRALNTEAYLYSAVIKEGNYNIDTLPWGTEGFQTIGYTNSYVGKEVQIVNRTDNGNYLLAKVEDKIIGWIDSRSVLKLKTIPVNYSKKILNGKYHINDLPWGTVGYKYLGTTGLIMDCTVAVTLESADGKYAFVFYDKKPIGWIDKRAFY